MVNYQVFTTPQDMLIDYVRIYSSSSDDSTDTCTVIGSDPYSSGSLIDCCNDGYKCLKDWNNNGNWFLFM